MSQDLVILVPDIDIQNTLLGLLSSRRHALGIREVSYKIFVNSNRDSGCFRDGPEFLRTFINQYKYVLIMFDREGCGGTGSRVDLEREVEHRLNINGWSERAAVIVLDPEIEIWVWSDSPHVDTILGWEGKDPSLRKWLKEKGFFIESEPKPARPKEAVEAALRIARKPRSPAIYKQLAEKVSLEQCIDPAFDKLKNTLRNWFAVDSPNPPQLP